MPPSKKQEVGQNRIANYLDRAVGFACFLKEDEMKKTLLILFMIFCLPQISRAQEEFQ